MRGGQSPRIRRTPVQVCTREGFLVNRVPIPYLKEASFLLEEGTSAAGTNRADVEFGFPMGPLALIAMAGLDILVLGDRPLPRGPRRGVGPGRAIHTE